MNSRVSICLILVESIEVILISFGKVVTRGESRVHKMVILNTLKTTVHSFYSFYRSLSFINVLLSDTHLGSPEVQRQYKWMLRLDYSDAALYGYAGAAAGGISFVSGDLSPNSLHLY